MGVVWEMEQLGTQQCWWGHTPGSAQQKTGSLCQCPGRNRMEQRVHFVLLAVHPGSLTELVSEQPLAQPHLAVPAFPRACLWDRDSSIEKKSFAGRSWLFPLWATF